MNTASPTRISSWGQSDVPLTAGHILRSAAGAIAGAARARRRPAPTRGKRPFRALGEQWVLTLSPAIAKRKAAEGVTKPNHAPSVMNGSRTAITTTAAEVVARRGCGRLRSGLRRVRSTKMTSTFRADSHGLRWIGGGHRHRITATVNRERADTGSATPCKLRVERRGLGLSSFRS